MEGSWFETHFHTLPNLDRPFVLKSFHVREGKTSITMNWKPVKWSCIYKLPFDIELCMVKDLENCSSDYREYQVYNSQVVTYERLQACTEYKVRYIKTHKWKNGREICGTIYEYVRVLLKY